MSVTTIVSVVIDGNTVEDVKNFIDECKKYCVPSDAPLLDYPAEMPIRGTGAVLADVFAWYDSFHDDPVDTVVCSGGEKTIVVDFPTVFIEPITCGDHVPQSVGGELVLPWNIHLVVNPECFDHCGAGELGASEKDDGTYHS